MLQNTTSAQVAATVAQKMTLTKLSPAIHQREREACSLQKTPAPEPRSETGDTTRTPPVSPRRTFYLMLLLTRLFEHSVRSSFSTEVRWSCTHHCVPRVTRMGSSTPKHGHCAQTKNCNLRYNTLTSPKDNNTRRAATTAKKKRHKTSKVRSRRSDSQHRKPSSA